MGSSITPLKEYRPCVNSYVLKTHKGNTIFTIGKSVGAKMFFTHRKPHMGIVTFLGDMYDLQVIDCGNNFMKAPIDQKAIFI